MRGYISGPMNQGYTLGTILKTLIHVSTFFSAGTPPPPTQYNYITFALIAKLILPWSLFVAFFLSAVTIPLVVALPGSAKPPPKRLLPSTSVFSWHG